jgi:hypothetical protein
MFYPVKGKIDCLLEEGYHTRYSSAQMIWERLRTGEPVLFKLIKEKKVIGQIFAEPDKLGVHFRELPVTDDYCRFHEEPVDEEMA